MRTLFYKVLILELLAIAGLVHLRFSQEAPARPTVAAVAVAAPATPAAVAPLPTTDPAPVRSTRAGGTVTFGELIFPVAGFGPEAVISVFGDKRGATRRHKGIDIKAPRGTEIVATVDGFIERLREGGSGGKQLYLRDAKGRLFYYAHLDGWLVEEMQAVTAGEAIGTVGDTGNARGTTPHLHFEVLLGKDRKAIDPLPLWVREATTQP